MSSGSQAYKHLRDYGATVISQDELTCEQACAQLAWRKTRAALREAFGVLVYPYYKVARGLGLTPTEQAVVWARAGEWARAWDLVEGMRAPHRDNMLSVLSHGTPGWMILRAALSPWAAHRSGAGPLCRHQVI